MIRFFVLIICLFALAVMVKAQVSNDKKQVSMPDSVKSPVTDYEEWLRNEPMKPDLNDSSALEPMDPSLDLQHPRDQIDNHPPLQLNIMTPRLRQDMRLAYQSHWLEEQRKEQVGGAMTIGLPILPLIALAVKKIFPKHKSKKERQREKLQQVLDNY
jgi:hypothetical protein